MQTSCPTASVPTLLHPTSPTSSLISSCHWLFGHPLSPSRAESYFPVVLLTTPPTKSLRYVGWVVPACWRAVLPFFWITLEIPDAGTAPFQRAATREGVAKVVESHLPPVPSFLLSTHFSFSCFFSHPSLTHTVESCQPSFCKLSDGLCPSVDGGPLTQSWQAGASQT